VVEVACGWNGTVGAPAFGVTAPRVIVRGATTALTRRTNLRKAFLAPWHQDVGDIYLYALADAQRHTGVAIHQAVPVISHHHMIVTPSSDNLPSFTKRAHEDISCGLNVLLAHHRYDAPGEIFDGRGTHHQRLVDAPSQAWRLTYDGINCVTAGLVDRPEHMPGALISIDMWLQGYIDVLRPKLYFEQDDDKRPPVIRMSVTPPPWLYAAFGGDMQRLVRYLRKLQDEGARAVRAARTRPALGARRVQQLHPWSEPMTLRSGAGRPVPSFSVGARGTVGIELSVAAATETREFRREHREVRLEHKDGNRERAFPFGTYAQRVVYGAAVQPSPKPGALLCLPGPLLSEVQEQLQAAREAGTGPSAVAVQQHTFELADAVRQVFQDDAAELCEEDHLDFNKAPAVVGDSAAGVDAAESAPDDKGERAAATTRHRFDKRARSQPSQQAGPQGARRLVILRDRRRGRPAGFGRRGSDPPV